MLNKTMILGAVAVMAAASSVRADFVVDLTTTGASGSANGAFYQQIDPQSTGTGVFDSFVRIQNNGTEQGYDTDSSSFQFDEKAGTWTHSLLLSAVPLVNRDGTLYRQFLLDVNQTNSSPLLSLDALQIFLGTAANLVNYPTFSGNATKVFDMDQGSDGNGYVKLDASLNSGSGSGDMAMFVPNSLFTGQNPYVYLYSHFGSAQATNDGFEEWGVGTGGTPTVIPLPAAAAQGLVALSGLGAVGLVRRAVRRLR